MKPLDGLTVLDFSRVLAGPMATMILAELGATVIKIERPRVGDETRKWEPRVGEESGYFFAFNRGKRSVTINLKSKAGLAVARSLAAKADILVENFLPGGMAAMGLDYSTLSQDNPGLVYLSNTGFGQTGPYADRPGYDTIFQALSGVMALTGYPDEPPAKVGVPFADLTSGLWIAIACLTGIVGRQASGRGCHIDLAMLDVQISMLTIAAARLFALGEDPARTGTGHLGRVPSEAFLCRDDRYLHISGSDQHWRPICATLGLAALADDETLASNAGRVADRYRVVTAMRDAIRQRDRSELADALRAVEVPTGEVNSVKEIIEDQHTRARDLVGTFDHPTVGAFPALRTPIRIDGFEDPAILVPPLLGADTRAVLEEMLHLSAGELDDLVAEGAI